MIVLYIHIGLWVVREHIYSKAKTSNKSSIPDIKVRGANMRPTWVLSAPSGPHIGPINLAIRDIIITALWYQWDGKGSVNEISVTGMTVDAV